MLKKAGKNDGLLSVSVRSSTAGEPAATWFDEVTVAESDFGPQSNWFEVSFTQATDLEINAEHFVVLSNVGSGSAGKISQGTGSTGSPETRYLSTTGSNPWSEESTKDLWLWVWGTSTAPDPAWVPPTEDWLRSIVIDISHPTADVATSSVLLNSPSP